MCICKFSKGQRKLIINNSATKPTLTKESIPDKQQEIQIVTIEAIPETRQEKPESFHARIRERILITNSQMWTFGFKKGRVINR